MASAGKTFVISGVLDSLTRSDAEDFIKRHGGRLTQAVSGKTSYLLVGSECGNSKLAAARSKDVALIDEDGLFHLVKATAHLVPKEEEEEDEVKVLGGTQGAAAAAAGAAQVFSALNATGLPSRPGAAAAAGPSRPLPSGAGAAPHAVSSLWVDKHKPRSLDELVGNVGLVGTLRTWLREWDNVHLRGDAPAEAKAGGKSKDLGKKAVLISGPPGIGKTTTALLICRELG
jgi:replication factor C subunit 1